MLIELFNAGVIPRRVPAQQVCAALGLSGAVFARVLEQRKRGRFTPPRANRDRALAPSGQKWCSTCAQYKPLCDFYRDKNAVDGRAHQCAECKRAYQRQRRAS